MQRLATLIVLIFSFAALAGVSTAHAHRFVSMPIVVLNLVDADNQSIPVVVKVQRGEIDLGGGIVMPCAPYNALPISAPQLPLPPLPEVPEAMSYPALSACLPPAPDRPPISA